jgi:hypothetical protein
MRIRTALEFTDTPRGLFLSAAISVWGAAMIAVDGTGVVPALFDQMWTTPVRVLIVVQSVPVLLWGSVPWISD